MHARTLCVILIIVLAIFIQGASADNSVRDVITITSTPTPTPVQEVRVIPTTTNPLGAVSIASIPSGATVIIDGSVAGSTPFTLRTLAPGSHSLLLQLGGYQDYSTTFTITSGTLNQQTYTLVPVTTSATTAPGISAIAATTTTAAPVTTAASLITFLTSTTPATPAPTPAFLPFSTEQTPPVATATLLPGVTAFNARLHPLVIGTGVSKKTVIVGSDSPYFPEMSVNNWSTIPLTSLDVDQYNTAKLYFGSNQALYAPPVWVDQKTVIIDKSLSEFDVNFRYFTEEKGVTAVDWQVSRYPFPDDPDHWQNKYIPGLVASGPVNVYHNDTDGYQYFVINFARIASHNAGDPPYYDGTISIDMDKQGVGYAEHETTIPLTSGVILTKNVNLGIISIPVPAGYTTIPPGEYTQAELGNLNDGQTLICSECLKTREPGAIESALGDMDTKYYVRVVPIHNGDAGIPAIPVEVTVSRPHPCPTVSQDVIVKPPSAQVLWYMQPNFYNSPGTDASYHWYYVQNGEFHPKGLHTYEPPVSEDKAWWQKVEDFFGSIINYFSDVMTGWSEAFNALEDLYVGFAAKVLSYTLTFGAYHCEDHPECTGPLKATLQSVMAAYGVPPELPTGPELESLSTDYLVQLGADQLGAGGVYDAYKELPDDVKDQLKGNPSTVSQALVNAQQEGMDNASEQAYCKDYPNPDYKYDQNLPQNLSFCNYKIPDPIFNAVHPGTVMLYITNPNDQATDRMTAEVSDSLGLYEKATAIIPPVGPGQGYAVPVVLTENYDQFKKINGGTCGTDDILAGLPCPQEKWMELWKSDVPDTFTVTFGASTNSCGPGGCFAVSGLTPQSSGKLLSSLLVMDPGTAGVCPTSVYLRYPQGWIMTTNGESTAAFSISGDPNMFTGSGFLRNTP
ncbi:PEGA domain-containing protein [Methanoregula sp.]|uniref:PEGA domain-containing protein n=1 Tax=Methanoregula sp. TaxID=2052170 RepID=UPI002B7CE5E6|nr:PEGA domain-containing protein [Methanoregula sp.]HVP96765.1 PEGA domain-containing protein [Methanoregula sp.]